MERLRYSDSNGHTEVAGDNIVPCSKALSGHGISYIMSTDYQSFHVFHTANYHHATKRCSNTNCWASSRTICYQQLSLGAISISSRTSVPGLVLLPVF